MDFEVPRPPEIAPRGQIPCFQNRAMHANNVCDVMSCNAISKFHHHVAELEAVQTFDDEFSESSPLHHPKLHDLNWGWTKGNSNLMVGS